MATSAYLPVGFLIGTILLLGPLGCVQEEEVTPINVVYAVSVFDSITGKPLADAEVIWTRSDGSYEAKLSDEKGAVRFSSSQSQQNLFEAFAEGYLAKDSIDVIDAVDSSGVTLLQHIKFQLTPIDLNKKVWIFFTVLDDSLRIPIEGVEIQIFLPNQNTPVLVTTDSLGDARWTYNQVGEYRIIVSAEAYLKQTFLDTLTLSDNSKMHTVLLKSK